jgi:hypothetical protein
VGSAPARKLASIVIRFQTRQGSENARRNALREGGYHEVLATQLRHGAGTNRV